MPFQDENQVLEVWGTRRIKEGEGEGEGAVSIPKEILEFSDLDVGDVVHFRTKEDHPEIMFTLPEEEKVSSDIEGEVRTYEDSIKGRLR